jgi:hypothetical protein
VAAAASVHLKPHSQRVVQTFPKSWCAAGAGLMVLSELLLAPLIEFFDGDTSTFAPD